MIPNLLEGTWVGYKNRQISVGPYKAEVGWAHVYSRQQLLPLSGEVRMVSVMF